MDKILIEALEVMAIIGIHDRERTTPQRVLIDLELGFESRAAIATDDIADTPGYGDIARAVTALVEASNYQLLESLAAAIAEMLLSDFNVEFVTVKVGKPDAIANARNVSVIIERER